jgi:hypothetical protein
MDQRLATLSVLFLAVVVSGCVGGGGGQGTQEQGGKAIAVHNIQVSPTEIFAGSNTRIRMSFSNVGELPAEVLIAKPGTGRNVGGQILTNSCPDIFDVASFSASSSNVSSTERSYALKPGYKVRLNWNLEQNSGNVPLNGYRCNLKFEVPFNYSVEAFKQLQVKTSGDVQGTEDLFSKSSKGPMKVELETIGSSAPSGAPTFLQSDEGEVLIQISNKQPDENSFTGNIRMAPPDVTARTIGFDGACPNPEEVPEDGLMLYQGQSKIFRCNLSWSGTNLGTAPSIKGEVFAQADYTYVKTAGTKTVKVKYRGN